jgi:hypothetical protein
MDTFIFQGDVYCADCAQGLKRDITANRPYNVGNEDSENWPQGPYAEGECEADTPQHCGACGEFLENPLTGDGVGYALQRILGAYDAADDSTWEKDSYSDHVARCLDRDGERVLATWARFYDLPDAPESESGE